MRAGSGFTLIELLIVIIVTLAGFLFPLVGRMRAKAGSTACVNNLRQLTAAAFVYSADNNGDLPRPTETAGGVLAWPDTLASYLGKERPFETELSAKTCPTQYAIHNQSRTFGINRQLDGNRQGLPRDTPTKMMVMTRAGNKNAELSTIPYFMDGVFTKNWLVYRSWAQDELNEKNFPHEGRCNMSFLDGHIEPTKPGLGVWSTSNRGFFDDGQPAF